MNKVVPRNGSSFFGFGSAQHNRAPKSLDPDYVKLDDRSLQELIAYSAELSKYIKYFDHEDKEDGSWEPFFYSDISVNIALIISVDLKTLDNISTHIVNEFYKTQTTESRTENFIKLYKQCLEICQNFNNWYQAILNLNIGDKRFESQIEFELYNIINDKVKPHFQELFAFKLASDKLKSLKALSEIEFDSMSDIWSIDRVKSSDIFNGKTELEMITAGMLGLRLQYQFLFQALNFTVNHFQRYFVNSLKFKDNHNPDIALFISFLKIFGNIQSDYNKITERLQAFYYNDILKLKPKVGKSDHSFVFFTLSDNVNRYILPANTKLNAGTGENGLDILFETEDILEITKAKIEKIRTVYNSRLDDLDTSNYKLTSHLYTAPVANSVDGVGRFEEIEYSWPIFGEEQEFKSSSESNMIEAELGFAFSSPVLNLREGKRTVIIRYDFLPESTRILKRLVYDIYLKVNKERKADEPAKILTEIFYERIFNQVDKERNFKVYLTGSTAWYEVEPNSIRFKAVGNGDWSFNTEIPDEDNLGILNSLEMSFVLPNAAPPIVSFDPKIHQGHNFDTFDPLIKLLLNDKKQPLIYSFLQSTELLKVNVKVEVDKIKQVNAYDEQLARYENKNFFPFGQEPQRGSLSYIGSPELFKKQLTEVGIHVEWDKLPPTVEEFEEYYKNYEKPLHPAELKIQIGVISDYEQKIPKDQILEFPLFTSTNGDLEIHPITDLTFSDYTLNASQIALLDILPNYDLPEENPYSDNLETGYFILELTEPRNALYNNIYQNQLQEAINHNVLNPEEQKKFPNPPVIPYIRNIHFSYKAEAEWNILHGDVNKPEMNFHIHPYGQEVVFEKGSVYKSQMLPAYNDDGYLFIGLKDINAPETISIFFELTSFDTADQTIKNTPRITWMFLSENKWIPFDDSKLIFDTTYGFTETGIVRLQLPITITDNNTILDAGYYWIGAKINGDVNKICKAVDIKCHGVIAKWVFEESLNHRLENPIQPDKIKSFLVNVPEIKNIEQPYASFGARLPEDLKAFNIRVSEKLRHKNRVITHWDIERITLEEFSNVHQVKALSHLSDPIELNDIHSKAYVFEDETTTEENYGIEHQSGVRLVVIPKVQRGINKKTPKFSLHRLLNIQKFLEQKVTPFMKLNVTNPKYEYVRIIANVKFIDNFNNGMTLNRLFEDINKFIAPWLYSPNEDVKIGGSINENVIQNYIKGLDYVKFLTKFSILHIIEDEGIYKLQDTAMEKDIVSIIKARPWGVLIPDDIHEIDMIEYEEEELPIPRVNSDQIIRFQNKVNILGDKKYIKVKNSKFKDKDDDRFSSDPTSNFVINI